MHGLGSRGDTILREPASPFARKVKNTAATGAKVVSAPKLARLQDSNRRGWAQAKRLKVQLAKLRDSNKRGWAVAKKAGAGWKLNWERVKKLRAQVRALGKKPAA